MFTAFEKFFGDVFAAVAADLVIVSSCNKYICGISVLLAGNIRQQWQLSQYSS